LDYPNTRPGPPDSDFYSLYYGYYNTPPPTDLAFSGGGDYGEVTCRTLPLIRKVAGSSSTEITDNACGHSGSWASFKYSYGYYEYVGKYLQAAHYGITLDITGLSRQMVTKELQLPSGTSSGRMWRYKRNVTWFTSPTRVVVTDPLGNDTVYSYHASQSSDVPNVGPDPNDGYAPEWNDGSNYEIDYFQGSSTTGRLLRSEIQEHDSDMDSLTHAHSKSNVRSKRSVKRYMDAGGVESVVSRGLWDGYGHWLSEVESGFDVQVPRTTLTSYQIGAIRKFCTGTNTTCSTDADCGGASGSCFAVGLYLTDLLRSKEVS